MAAALASATGGVWNTTGNDAGNLWIDRSLHPPATLTFVIGAAQAQILDEDIRGRGSLGGDRAQRRIRVALPASVWAPFADTGQTVFERYDKNVLGLPFIMAGDFFFDDAAMTVRVGERSAG